MKTIFPFDSKISYVDRVALMGQQPLVIWFTGLSGSGKSTLATRLEHHLFKSGYKVFLLDGDNIRSGLNKDLSFSDDDRKENIRRIGEVAKLMLDAGLIVISAFISPFQEDRTAIKSIVGEERFLEIFVDCPIEVCESRDIKGLYARARKGEIKKFTGIDSPYEAPLQPDLTIKTAEVPVDQALELLINLLETKLQA